MSQKYLLKPDHSVIRTNDLNAWAEAFGSMDRIVAKTAIDGVEVSTVFLGLDHQFGDGPPLLFETMVFNGPLDGEQDRYSTWADAEAGHAAMVERVTAAMVAK